MSLPSLLKVAGGVAVVGLGASIWIEKRLQSTYRQQGFYQKSVQLLQNYTPAAQFLGKPIFSGRVKLGDETKLSVNDFSAKLVIPVVGSKDKGTLHVQASRQDKHKEWSIDQLDLEINSSNQRWTFYHGNMNGAPEPPPQSQEVTDSSSPPADNPQS